MRSKRFEVLDARPVNQDGFVAEWPEVGLIAMDGPNDPKPSITIENGVVVELDGKRRADFDMLDTFIATYGMNLERAVEVNAMDSVRLAHMLMRHQRAAPRAHPADHRHDAREGGRGGLQVERARDDVGGDEVPRPQDAG